MLKQNFDVQSIGISVPSAKVFEFVAKPENLPKWTNAFSEANESAAVMVTPHGEASIKLTTVISRATGTIDWIMTMPDGAVGKAFSRVTENGEATVYSFVLLAPPVPLEQIEGTLEIQKAVLAQELVNLKTILEKL